MGNIQLRDFFYDFFVIIHVFLHSCHYDNRRLFLLMRKRKTESLEANEKEQVGPGQGLDLPGQLWSSKRLAAVCANAYIICMNMLS